MGSSKAFAGGTRSKDGNLSADKGPKDVKDRSRASDRGPHKWLHSCVASLLVFFCTWNEAEAEFVSVNSRHKGAEIQLLVIVVGHFFETIYCMLYLKANPDWSLIFIIYLRVRGAKGFGSWKRQMPILHHLQLYSNKGEETWRLEFLACACAHKNLFCRSPNTHEVRALKILIDEESKLCTYCTKKGKLKRRSLAVRTTMRLLSRHGNSCSYCIHPTPPTHTHS